jgi:uncharacterized damage-inducible protein DinB
MIDTQYIRLMTRYSRWMNDNIYAACLRLPDTERKRDAGAFFKSIHGTLNHLALTDNIWLGRFRSEPFAFNTLADELHADFDALNAARQRTDAELEAVLLGMDDARLRERITYRTASPPHSERTYPVGFIAVHVFNHQTHHRGQVTTLLKQAGVDPGVTDLPWMPGVDALP